MSTTTQLLMPLVEEYVAQRRALGFELRKVSRSLREFAQFADSTAPGQPITTVLALKWVTQSPKARAYRLTAVRLFARFCALSDPRTEIPPSHLFANEWKRIAPHIYTPAQVRLMMRRAARLGTKNSPLRPAMAATFVGLMAVTGMRVDEALRLRLCDFDRQAGTLLVRATKTSPTRLLPLHPSTVQALICYQRKRERVAPSSELFFAGARGGAFKLSYSFRELIDGIKCNGARARPRPYDLRHTFATGWVAQWSREAAPLSHYLLRLSAYLGHRDLSATWWYVSGDKHSLHAAVTRFDHYRHGRDATSS